MTDYVSARAAPSAAPVIRSSENETDRNLGLLVYGLYLLGFFTAFASAVVGVAIAYARRIDAHPVSRGHFDHQIKTFWIVLGLGALSVLLLILAGVAAATDFFQFVGNGSGWDAWDVAAFDGDDLRITPLTLSLFAASMFTAGLSTLWLLGDSLFGLARLASSRRVGQAPA